MTHDATLRTKAATSLGACTARIMKTFALASEEQIRAGSAWYASARAEAASMAAAGGITVDRAACVIAHLSPRTAWARNIRAAWDVVTDGDTMINMAANVERAKAALVADDPWTTFGPDALKTRRFAANIAGDDSVVTVDVWALRVAFGRGWGKAWRQNASTDAELIRMLGRAGVYAGIERAYLNAATRLNLPATTVQAVTWGIARNGRFG